MNQTEILAKLQLVFDDVFLEPPKVTPQLTAKDVPEWDSLLHISLLLAVEKAFNIRFESVRWRERRPWANLLT